MCRDHDAIAFILSRRSQLAGDMEDPAEALDAALNIASQGPSAYGAVIQSLQKSLSRLPGGYPRDRGVYLAREAVAHIGNSDVEQISTVGLQALAIGAETGSSRIIGELRYLDTSLRKFSTTAGAADFHDAMHGTFPCGNPADHTVERERN